VNSSSKSYSANGDLTPLPTGATATYDAAQELTSSVLSGTTTDYTLNTLGGRVTTTVGGSSTIAASDDQNGAYGAELSSQDTSPITQVSAGFLHTLAVHADGTLWGWGANNAGELGLGTTTDHDSPQQNTSISQVTDAAAGGTWDGDGFSAAVTSTGSLYTWGYNVDGELGNGSTSSTPTLTPTKLTSISDVAQVAAGNQFMVALKGDGTVYAWGSNYYGELGDGNTTNEDTPQEVSGLTGVVQVVANGSSAAALTASGAVYTWGYNGDGELGIGSTASQDTPQLVTFTGLSGAKIKSLSMGPSDTLAVTTSNTVYGWGQNYYGELGDGSTTEQQSPQKQSYDALEVSVGGNASVMEETNGNVYTMGSNSSGQLGLGSLSPSSADTPQEVSGLSDPGQLAAGGYNYNLVLGSAGSLKGFGSDSNGQLGNSSTTNTDSPVTSDTQTSYAWQSYAYGGNGLRAGVTNIVPTSTTSTDVWDTTTGTPQILSDGTDSFIYGPQGQVVEQISQQGTPQYLVHDQLGSTRMILNAQGNPTGTFTYDAYGNLTRETGTATTPIGFAGGYTDAATGNLYLQARYYDPRTATFLTVDPLVSQTMQPYQYANDNPVNDTDPSGDMTLGICAGFGLALGPISLGANDCLTRTIDASGEDDIGVTGTAFVGLGVSLEADISIYYEVSNATNLQQLKGAFTYANASATYVVGGTATVFWNNHLGNGAIYGVGVGVTLGLGASASGGESYSFVRQFNGTISANIARGAWDAANPIIPTLNNLNKILGSFKPQILADQTVAPSSPTSSSPTSSPC
jgi:RHS repeat-associated protein